MQKMYTSGCDGLSFLMKIQARSLGCNQDTANAWKMLAWIKSYSSYAWMTWKHDSLDTHKHFRLNPQEMQTEQYLHVLQANSVSSHLAHHIRKSEYIPGRAVSKPHIPRIHPENRQNSCIEFCIAIECFLLHTALSTFLYIFTTMMDPGNSHSTGAS